MPLLGAHMSIAGGYYRAVEAAAAFRMDTVQIFTKNNNQWRAKPLSAEDVQQFRDALQRHGLQKPCAHSSYLINLASPDASLWKKSLQAFIVELERAEALGLRGVVIHPGSAVDSSEAAGLKRIVRAVDKSLRETRGFAVEIWLECTAGQGSSLGWRFEHLQWIIEQAADAERVGVCLDTCHLFAAGYPLNKPAEYRRTMQRFDELIGLSRVRAFHLNDSKREFGSRVDRHEHIGEGRLGREAFRHILTDARFAKLPMYLETPKGKRARDGKEWDAVNLAKLRRMLRPSRRKTP